MTKKQYRDEGISLRKTQHDLIASKIEAINKELTESNEGLPPITISVGITHGTEAPDAESLFEKTDAAMYHAKQSGKRTYKFNSRRQAEKEQEQSEIGTEDQE